MEGSIVHVAPLITAHTSWVIPVAFAMLVVAIVCFVLGGTMLARRAARRRPPETSRHTRS